MWVGLIAVGGVAAETGIVMVVYLDEGTQRYLRERVGLNKPEDVDAAVIEGASMRTPADRDGSDNRAGLCRPLGSGVGGRVGPNRGPVVGGLGRACSSRFLVLPAAYTMWRSDGQLRWE